MGSVVDFLQTFGELLKVKHICAVIIKIMKVKVNSINYYFLFFIFQVTFTNVFIEIEQAPCNKNVFHIAREFEHSLVFCLFMNKSLHLLRKCLIVFQEIWENWDIFPKAMCTSG